MTAPLTGPLNSPQLPARHIADPATRPLLYQHRRKSTFLHKISPTRHIFVVNNFTSFLSAFATIRGTGLDPNEVGFLLMRDIYVGHAFESHIIKPSNSRRRVVRLLAPSFRPRKARRAVRALDRSIHHFSPGSFHAYFANTRMHSFPFLTTHPKCAGFSVLEEGIAAYLLGCQPLSTPFHEDSDLYYKLSFRLKALLSFGPRYWKRTSFYESGYENLFCFSDRAFAPHPRRVVFDLHQTIHELLHFDPSFGEDLPELEPDAIIFIFDGRNPNDSEFFERFVEFAADLVAHGRPIYFRRHINHYHIYKFSTFIYRLRQRLPNLCIKEIDRNIPIEVIGYWYPHITFIFDRSSAGLYLHLLGASAYRMHFTDADDVETVLAPVPAWPGVAQATVKPCGHAAD